MQRPLAILALCAAIVAGCKSKPVASITEIPSIPGEAYSIGVSAPFCGTIGETLVVAGGANFPDKPLVEGGSKKVYDDIWTFKGGQWTLAGHLPEPVAYGATFAVPDGLVLVGGTVDGAPSDKVYLLTLEDGKASLRKLPSLPNCVAEAGAASCEDRLYLVGGIGSEYIYSCHTGEYIWEQVTKLPIPLIQPLAFAAPSSLFFWGGYDPVTLRALSDGWHLSGGRLEPVAGVPDGGTFVGSTGVVLPDGRFAVIGGVNREIFSRALHNTDEERADYFSKEPSEYHFRSDIYAFSAETMSWQLIATAPECALAGAGVAVVDGDVMVVGGEIKPGVRTPRIFSMSL